MPAPLGNTSGRKWKPVHDTALRSFVETNDLSYAAIAAKLNEQFGTTYSRNAAIGRAGRMGLINPFKVKKCKTPEYRKARNKPHPRIIASNGNSTMRVIQSVENVADMKLRCVEIVPRNISLIDLERNDCRYPYGDGSFTFCGHPKMEGSSYCGAHFALTKKDMRGVNYDQTAAQRAAHRKIIRANFLSLRREYNGEDAA